MLLRKLLDSIEPLFTKGPLKLLYPLYEANDTFLFNPGDTAKGKTHVRDSLDTKRMMITVVIALIPCILMAMYNTGFQASKIIQLSGTEIDTTQLSNIRYLIMETLGITYNWVVDLPANPSEHAQAAHQAWYDNLLNPAAAINHIVHGAFYFLPVYLVCMAAGGTSELIFSVIRKHEINEGFLVTGMLFPLTLPPGIPLWQVAIGIVFGVVIGKEIFGGTGKNFLNPALTARAFLYFAYPKQISGDVWTAVDGYSGPTALGAIASAKIATDEDGTVTGTVPQVVESISGNVPDYSESIATGSSGWWDSFFGNIHGSMGETSALCCLIGAVILIMARVGSWRIMAGVVIGAAAFSFLLDFLPKEETSFHIMPWWHFVIGGFAFGTVFMATDPVSASMTQTGKWIYGGLIGFMTVLVRSMNPAFPEGIMLAILFGNVFAPLIDYFVVQANIKRRLARHEKS